jgi:AraC-like DNA-binding protein
MIGPRRRYRFSVRLKSNRRTMPQHFEHESVFAPCQGRRSATEDLAVRLALASRSPLASCRACQFEAWAKHINNGMKVPYSPSKGSVGAPGVLALSSEADLEILAVFMKPDALHNTLSVLIGAPVGKKLELDRSNYNGRPEPRAVRNLARVMVMELDHEGDLSPLVLAELEQAILVAFLTGTGHNYAHLLDGRPRGLAPPQVRLVEEYIEAHWNQSVSIEGLAVVANASARSVFHAFREFRGYSPMNFLKRERLRHAKKMLANPTSNESVTNVTFACGFGNMGRFADDYQKAFGEMPSETLNRASAVTFDRDKARPHRPIPARAK